MSLNNALNDIRSGKMVLVYDFDDRECETDMTIASQFAAPNVLRTMRKDGGGLICTTTPFNIARDLGLPFLSDVFFDPVKYPLLKAMAPNDIPYDDTRSSFGVTINHRKTFTGVTDNDRSFTITEYVKTIFSDATAEERMISLGNNFRAPGHVHLLNASEKVLESRRGHTELTTALMIMAGVRPSATICEMIGDDGDAMPKEEAKLYARKNGYTFVEGDEITEEWKKR